MVSLFYRTPHVLRGLKKGPLAPHLDAYAKLLSDQGYATLSAKNKIRLVANLSCWLHCNHLGIDNLDEQTVDKFLTYRRRTARHLRGNCVTLHAFLEHLRDRAIIPRPILKEDNSVLYGIEHDYEKYLAEERGLSLATLINYLPIVRHFLSNRFKRGNIVFHKLCPHDSTNFILRYAHTKSPGRAKLMVTALRSFFNYLRLRGEIETDLAASLPTVANWRLSGLPKSIKPDEVTRLLKSCNQTTAVGLRNYTILLILARFGLRAGEVVAMRLEDIDWENGVLTIHGKGLQRDRLPLPHDVGETLAKYLRYGRPHCSSRSLFVRMYAPIRGFANSVNVCSIVSRALKQAGLNPACKGAHLLRHSLATNMLRKGSSLSEIGEILRHRSPNTTEIYAKVDQSALNMIVQKWPGGTI